MESEPKPKSIPYSVEAEEAVIGAVLIDPDAYHSVAQVIQPGDFYIHRHRFIWEAITRLQERQIPLDFLTITDELDQAGKLNEIGGTAYLTGLINQVPTSLHAGAYAQIIKDMATRRHILEAASRIAKLAHSKGTDMEEVIQETERTISSIRQGRPSLGIKSLSEILEYRG